MNSIKLNKQHKFFKEKILVVTVDLGKRYNVGFAQTLEGKELSPFGFQNNLSGYIYFYNKIDDFRKKENLEKLLVGFESTGSYGEPLKRFLKSKKVDMAQVNPVHTKRFQELEDNSPNKTDYKDPRIIASLIVLGKYLTVFTPEDDYLDLRKLVHERERIKININRTCNQMESIVSGFFPELLTLTKTIMSKTTLYLLKNFNNVKKILALNLEDFLNTLKIIGRGRVKKEKITSLYEIAELYSQENICMSESNSTILDNLLCELDYYQGKLTKLEETIEEILLKVDISKYIVSIKGIGIMTAAYLLGEIGNFENFSSPEEILKLAGLNLYERSSGMHKGKRRISKRGRGLLRKILYLTAVRLSNKSGVMHSKYQANLKKGMPKVKALIAISRKLVYIIFSLVKNKTEFIEDYENRKHKKIAPEKAA